MPDRKPGRALDLQNWLETRMPCRLKKRRCGRQIIPGDKKRKSGKACKGEKESKEKGEKTKKSKTI